MTPWISILIGYVLGSIQSGYYLTRILKGADLRKIGSGSTGARNTGRILGPAGFVVVFLADAGKTMVALWIATRLKAPDEIRVLVLPAVVTGHIWPVQLGFKGGRGVAAALGGLLYLDPMLLALPGITAVGCLAATRRFSQSLALAFLALPFGALILERPREMVLSGALTSLLILFAHRGYFSSSVLMGNNAAVETRPGG